MSTEIRVEGVEHVFPCRDHETVLGALGPIHRLRVVSGCRNGGCGVCKIEILSGDAQLGLMSAAHVSPEERARGVALACRVVPRSNLVVRLLPKPRPTWAVSYMAPNPLKREG